MNFDEITDFNEILWPICGDKLVSDIGEQQMNACLNWQKESMHAYTEGYRLAAERLLASLRENNIFIDCIVYPILFLYRHYTELSLKTAIYYARGLESEALDFPKHHNIELLWKEFKERAERIERIEGDKTLLAVEDLILQFSDLDPLSFSFRYPKTKDGEKSLPDTLKLVNLEKFHDSMRRLSNFFEGIISQYMEYYDNLGSFY